MKIKKKLNTNQKSDNYPEEIKIVSPRGNIYTVVGFGYPLCDPFCDCRGFRFNGTCSHIKKLLEEEDE